MELIGSGYESGNGSNWDDDSYCASSIQVDYGSDSDRGFISDNESKETNGKLESSNNYVGINFGELMANPNLFCDISKYIFEFLSLSDLYTTKLVNNSYYQMMGFNGNDNVLIQIYAKNIYNVLKYGKLLNKESIFYQSMSKSNEKYVIEEWLFMDESNCLFSSLKVNTFSKFVKRILPLFTEQICVCLERYKTKHEPWAFVRMYECSFFNRYGYEMRDPFFRRVIEKDIANKNSWTRNGLPKTQKRFLEKKKETKNFTSHKECMKIIMQFCNLIITDIDKMWHKNIDEKNKYFGFLMEIFGHFIRQAYISKNNELFDENVNVYIWENLAKWLLLTFDNIFIKNEKMCDIYRNNHHSYKFDKYHEPRLHSWYEFMFLLQNQTKRYFQTYFDVYAKSVTLNDKKRLLGEKNYNWCYDSEYKKPFVSKLSHIIKQLNSESDEKVANSNSNENENSNSNESESETRDDASLENEEESEESGLYFGKEYNNIAHSWCDTVLAFKINNLLSMYILSNDRMNIVYDCQSLYLKSLNDVSDNLSYLADANLREHGRNLTYLNDGMTLIDSILNSKCNLIINKLFDSSYYCLLNNDPIYQCIKELDHYLWNVNYNKRIKNNENNEPYEFVASFKRECDKNKTAISGNNNNNNGLSDFAFASLNVSQYYTIYNDDLPEQKSLGYNEEINHDHFRWFQFLSQKSEQKRLGYIN